MNKSYKYKGLALASLAEIERLKSEKNKISTKIDFTQKPASTEFYSSKIK